MSSNQPDWLDVREAHDHVARSKTLALRFLQHLSPGSRLIDLACGSGSNIRYLLPIGGQSHRWLCVDHDATVLMRALENLSATQVDAQQIDLASDLSQLFRSPFDAVTASAFLDITSAPWLDQFAVAIASVPFLAAMTLSGPVALYPESAADASIQKLLSVHQCSDHGFGPALGPDASKYLSTRLKQLGNAVTTEHSDWILGPTDRDTQRILVNGIAKRMHLLLAKDIGASKMQIDEWSEERNLQIDAGALRMVVPHADLLSLPPR
ncbi:MAG: class I SAM-dependent methyltransferase [Pirellulaceae bacterium]